MTVRHFLGTAGAASYSIMGSVGGARLLLTTTTPSGSEVEYPHTLSPGTENNGSWASPLGSPGILNWITTGSTSVSVEVIAAGGNISYALRVYRAASDGALIQAPAATHQTGTGIKSFSYTNANWNANGARASNNRLVTVMEITNTHMMNAEGLTWLYNSANSYVDAPWSANPPTTAPTLSVGTITHDTIPLSWTSVSGATTYELQRNTVTIQNTSALSRNDTGLSPSTQYSYRVRAVNSGGSGPWSNVLTPTTAAPPLAAPTGLALTPISTATEYGFSAGWNPVDGAVGYVVHLTIVDGAEVGEFPFEGTSIDFPDAPPDRYEIRVRAVNATEEGPWSPAQQIDLRLGAPVLTVASVGADSIGLEWSAVPLAYYYEVERDEATLAYVEQDVVYLDTGLTPGTYSYRVRVVVPTGEGPWSNVVTPTAGAASPHIGFGDIVAVGELEGEGKSPHSGSGDITGIGQIEGQGVSQEVIIITYGEGGPTYGQLFSGETYGTFGYEFVLPEHVGSGDIVAVGELTGEGISPEVTPHVGAGDIEAVGSLAGEGIKPTIPGAAGEGDITAVGSLEGEGYAPHVGSGDIDAVADLDAQGVSNRLGSGDIDAIADLDGQGISNRVGFGDIDAVGDLEAEGKTSKTGSGDIEAIGSLVGEGIKPTIPGAGGEGDITAIGVLEGEGYAPHVGEGYITAYGELEGQGVSNRTGSGFITTFGELEAQGYKESRGEGFITAFGEIEGVGYVKTTGFGEITAIGVITGQGPKQDAPPDSRPFALLYDKSDRPLNFDTFVTPEQFQESLRDLHWDHITRDMVVGDDSRDQRFEEDERSLTIDEFLRSGHHFEDDRPLPVFEIVFVREDIPVELTIVAYGPYTVNEIPESLYVKVRSKLRTGGTKALDLFGKTPPWMATVSIEKPSGEKIHRPATVVDPADLPVLDPDNFEAPEQGWVKVDFADGDFDESAIEGGPQYAIQLTLDNTVLRLKSTVVWEPHVRTGPAAEVGV